MGGATIVLRSLKTKGNKKFQDRPNFYLFNKSNPLYLLKIVSQKFDPLTATGIAVCVHIGPKCQFFLA